MEDISFLWNTFSATGSIDAYLQYKSSCEKEKKEDEKCQVSTQEVLL